MVAVVEADADELRRPWNGSEETEPIEGNGAGGVGESGRFDRRARLGPARDDAENVGKSKRGEADDAVEGEDAGFGVAAGALKGYKTHARKWSPWNVLKGFGERDRTQIISQIGAWRHLSDQSLIP